MIKAPQSGKTSISADRIDIARKDIGEIKGESHE